MEMLPVQAGISFMDRPDQASHFKINLPWVQKTPRGVDSVFLPPINRSAPLALLTGLVESDWYAHPVNRVDNRPLAGSLHVQRGDVLAQIVFIDRLARRVAPELRPPDASEAAAMKESLRLGSCTTPPTAAPIAAWRAASTAGAAANPPE